MPSFTFLGYELRKAEPQSWIFRIRIKKPIRDYYDMFRAGAGEPVCSSGDTIHVIKSKPGTKPIHSDNEPLYEKYLVGAKPLRSMFIVLALAAVGRCIMDYSIYFQSARMECGDSEYFPSNLCCEYRLNCPSPYD
ncbi:DUF2812 domain-containing protein [Paenibacillus sp. OAS669]|uniref:DUF2812 domain-containing protein n=1 Tax=Paenibacillus sp. OAS669 TaxID=2663821 RepID=UPI00178B6000